MSDAWIVPDWPAPARVRALSTTRAGGVSVAPYDSLNLGTHVGDDPACVAANRAVVRRLLPSEPAWLNQVHGTAVVDAAAVGSDPALLRRAAQRHEEDPCPGRLDLGSQRGIRLCGLRAKGHLRQRAHPQPRELDRESRQHRLPDLGRGTQKPHRDPFALRGTQHLEHQRRPVDP